jgi:hypothetical protein
MRKYLVGAVLLAVPMLASSSGTASACFWEYSYAAPAYGYYSRPRYYRYSYAPRRRVYGYYASPEISFYVGPRYRHRYYRSGWWW